MEQTIYCGIKHLSEALCSASATRPLLVCDQAFPFLKIHQLVNDTVAPAAIFRDFGANPLYEDVCNGVNLFRHFDCDAIVAVGGGSAMDVAKCIKLFCKMNSAQNYLVQDYVDSHIPLIAIPTTAGTGSESTRFAVIYHAVEKQSIAHESILPSCVILEPSVLETLPLYQKKCTLLDALCQGIESWWSVNSTEESKVYSRKAIEGVIKNMDAYLTQYTEDTAMHLLLAANYAGRAINITQTTAPHAMSYKLTSMCNLPHGHAVAVCLPVVWQYMSTHIENCIDQRGSCYLSNIFLDIAHALGCENVATGIEGFFKIIGMLQIHNPTLSNRADALETLTASVNLTRLKNNPVALNSAALYSIYERILQP